jgi:hypothetical protein
LFGSFALDLLIHASASLNFTFPISKGQVCRSILAEAVLGAVFAGE